jgi:hypothetical protein
MLNREPSTKQACSLPSQGHLEGGQNVKSQPQYNVSCAVNLGHLVAIDCHHQVVMDLKGHTGASEA